MSIMGSRGLVLAALAALVLSACAPMAEAIRVAPLTGPCRSSFFNPSCLCLPYACTCPCACLHVPLTCLHAPFTWPRVSSTCHPPVADTCVLRNCGSNSRCVKDNAGSADCVAHSCALLVCDPNASCVKENGLATLLPCSLLSAALLAVPPALLAVLAALPSVATVLLARLSSAFAWPLSPCSSLPLPLTCTRHTARADTCVLKDCLNATCSKDAAGAASCACHPDFALQPDGHTCKGTHGTCLGAAAVRSYFVCLPVLVRASVVPTFPWFPSSPLPTLVSPLCHPSPHPDTCAIKRCGVNGQCKKDAKGVASCECATGFALQADGRTCIDTCEIQSCGVNGQCKKDAKGAASCECATGFALQADNRTCTGMFRGHSVPDVLLPPLSYARAVAAVLQSSHLP
ncbi:unnamed protein product [Closterium sp. Naga37s-1]|nr:unnamed protein product [Closterium sp. Naga37s-1]